MALEEDLTDAVWGGLSPRQRAQISHDIQRVA